MKKVFWVLMLAVLVPATAGATGLLIPSDGSIGPLAIKYHRADVKIKDRVAVTHVDQVFVNSIDRDLEATYIFPLPKGATVSDFYLYVNGKRTKGEILEKEKARNIYEGIVRRMQDPGLLEYLGNDLFQARIYPVPRRGEQRVEIEFTQVMPFESGVMKYTYPMKTDRASARTMQDFTLSVNIESKTPIKSIYSPSHSIYSRKQDDHRATAGFEKMAAVLDHDFELFYAVSEKDIGLNLLTYREGGEPGFFLMMASPKSEYADREIMGKRITFVIDSSGSMEGQKMKSAKEALKYCLNKLNPDDLFNVVRFSTDVEPFEKIPVSASKENVQRAVNFVDRMEAAGGTAIDEALSVALAGYDKKEEPNLVAFITDGNPTVGDTDLKVILAHVQSKNKTGARFFVFGVGDDINTHLLDRLASENFGDSTYVKGNGEIAQRLPAFYDKVSHPVLSDLQMDFGSLHEYDVFPRQMPDLFKGSQLIVLGRFRNDGHTAVTLNGKVGKDAKSFVYEGAFPKDARDNNFIPRLWATRKIGYLLDNIRMGGEKKELVDEVVQLSKRYGIVTPYTSYLVTEDTQQQIAIPSMPRPEPRRPLTTRPGWSEDERRGAAQPSESMMPSTAAGAPPPAKRAEKAKADDRVRVFSEKKGQLMAEESGSAAVNFADAVKDMKSADGARSDEDDSAGIRYLEGRTFQYKNGGWVDLQYQAGMKTLEVRYLGKAYFELIQRSATLKSLFSLGERITIVVGTNTALIISKSGRDEVPESELKSFIP
jgi:Ca-activated chloride channel homolog